MSFIITCYTLHDITPSGVISRHAGLGENQNEWIRKRNTQSNFDTILQAISLRSQPEIIDNPAKSMIKFDDDKFGFLFEQVEDEEYPCWSFDFSIMHTSVFDNGISELGFLYIDCDQVPMIKCDTAWEKIPALLDTSDELRNIYFKVKNETT